MTEEHIHHPVLDTLEDHTDQLSNIRKVVMRITSNFNDNKDSLSERNLEVMSNVLHDSLESVSDLSIQMVEVSMVLKEYYEKKFIKSPAMGTNLFEKLYRQLHKPYDDLKDLIWKSIFQIEDHQINLL